MLKSCAAFLALALIISPALANDAADSKAVRSEDGKFYDKDDNPTYNIQADGTVDWFTYGGFRLYHAECHVCHGPDGLGSSYAPALADSLKTMDYAQFMDVVINGKQEVNTSQQKVMPAFGLNKVVACHIDDLYIYLRARADGVLPRGRPMKREDKTDATRAAEEACMAN
jgi:methanol metabolism-related c-type cytochrome